MLSVGLKRKKQQCSARKYKLVVNYEILVKYFIVILIATLKDTIDGPHGKGELISESVLC